MKIRLGLLLLALLCAGIILGGGVAFAQYGTYGPPPPPSGGGYGQYGQYGQYGYDQYGPMNQTLGDRELRNLVAPIALYSDPLLGIILPASSYVDDIIDADRKNLGNDERAIQRQYWDISVKALAHYPGIVRMMARDPEWTAALGQAYVYQPQDLMDAIQYLRQRAWDNGVLRSNRWQTVSRSGGYIRIYPAAGNYIYVPQYDPDVVYLSRRSNNYGSNLLSFGLGLIIGSWLDNDTDWHRHRVYRHGWEGGRDWFGGFSKRFNQDKYYGQDKNRSIVGNHDIIRRPVDYGKVRTFKLPGVSNDKPLNYPKHAPKVDNRGRGNQGGDNQGNGGNQGGDHQGGNQGGDNQGNGGNQGGGDHQGRDHQGGNNTDQNN
jgi:hypothetical protein